MTRETTVEVQRRSPNDGERVRTERASPVSASSVEGDSAVPEEVA